MSNRGRQNVASFLAKDLNIDWRMGAEWFEYLLVDHDPTSNYGILFFFKVNVPNSNPGPQATGSMLLAWAMIRERTDVSTC